MARHSPKLPHGVTGLNNNPALAHVLLLGHGPTMAIRFMITDRADFACLRLLLEYGASPRDTRSIICSTGKTETVCVCCSTPEPIRTSGISGPKPRCTGLSGAGAARRLLPPCWMREPKSMRAGTTALRHMRWQCGAVKRKRPNCRKRAALILRLSAAAGICGQPLHGGGTSAARRGHSDMHARRTWRYRAALGVLERLCRSGTDTHCRWRVATVKDYAEAARLPGV